MPVSVSVRVWAYEVVLVYDDQNYPDLVDDLSNKAHSLFERGLETLRDKDIAIFSEEMMDDFLEE